MAVNNDDAVKTTAVEAKPKPTVQGPNPVMHFLREVQAELKKTSWPTRNELTKFVIVVMTVLVSVSLYLFVCNFIMNELSGWLFGTPSTPGPH